MLLVVCSIENNGVNSPGLSETNESATPPIQTSAIIEQDILEIPLPNELASASMEYSGLAWYKESLILLPQYPNRLAGDRSGSLYAIDQQNLVEFINNPKTEIKVRTIPFDDAGLSKQLDGFEGFEAIVFIEDAVYMTIETRGGNPMKSFLVRGTVESSQENLSSISLDGSSLWNCQYKTIAAMPATKP